jgi:hypothetical protein
MDHVPFVSGCHWGYACYISVSRFKYLQNYELGSHPSIREHTDGILRNSRIINGP